MHWMTDDKSWSLKQSGWQTKEVKKKKCNKQAIRAWCKQSCVCAVFLIRLDIHIVDIHISYWAERRSMSSEGRIHDMLLEINF